MKKMQITLGAFVVLALGSGVLATTTNAQTDALAGGEASCQIGDIVVSGPNACEATATGCRCW